MSDPDFRKLLEQAAKLLLQAGGLHDAHSGGTVIGTRDIYTETLQARADCYALGHQINGALDEGEDVVCLSCGMPGTPFPDEDPVICGNCGGEATMRDDPAVDSYILELDMTVEEIRARLEKLNRTPGSLFYGVLDKIRAEKEQEKGR